VPVKLGFIILSIIGVLRIPEEFYLYKDNDKEFESKYLSKLPVKVQIKFAKALLGVNKQAVLGELGMYPIFIHALKSAIEYWFHNINQKILFCIKLMKLIKVYPTALRQELKYF
jgi:hypothetical protein